MRHWAEMFAWEDIECLVRVSLQKLRERWEEAAVKGLCSGNKNLVRLGRLKKKKKKMKKGNNT